MKTKKVREYELYLKEDGKFTCYSKYYNGTVHSVDAKSLKQAYFLTYKNEWKIKENGVGINQIETKRDRELITWKQKLED